MQQISANYPKFGQYVSRKELIDRVEQMKIHAPGGSGVSDATENDAFLRSLVQYPGDSLEQIRASAAKYEERMQTFKTVGYVVGGAAILSSFAALGYVCHCISAGGMGGIVAGLAVFAAANYAGHKAVAKSNQMLEKADNHARFQVSLQNWVNFLADERARQFEEVSKMSNAKLAADGIQSTTDAVKINGIWIPRRT